MTMIEPGTTAYVEGYGTFGVYNNEDELTNYATSNNRGLIPSDNVDNSQYITNAQGHSLRAIPAATPPSIRAVSTKFQYHGVGDYQHLNEYYTPAYTAETGKAPGAWFLIVLLILQIILSLWPIWVAILGAIVLMHLIDASSGDTTEQYTDPNGDTIYKSCARSFLGGTDCVFYNSRTGQTSDAGSNSGFNEIIKWGLIIVGIGAGAYIGFKIILPALTKKKEGA